MARYIDADKLNTRARGNNSQRTMWREIKRIVDDAPTADVVPKSEVAREIFEEIEDLFFNKYLLGNITASLFEDKYAELKKKYTGE